MKYCPDIGGNYRVPVISKLKAEDRFFSVLKIPHHGSRTWYNKDDWDDILDPACYLKLTPFRKHNLPEAGMVTEIKSHSENVFTTSLDKGSFKRHSSNLKKKLKRMDIKMKRLNEDTSGIVKFELDGGIIKPILDGTAYQL